MSFFGHLACVGWSFACDNYFLDFSLFCCFDTCWEIINVNQKANLSEICQFQLSYVQNIYFCLPARLDVFKYSFEWESNVLPIKVVDVSYCALLYRNKEMISNTTLKYITHIGITFEKFKRNLITILDTCKSENHLNSF